MTAPDYTTYLAATDLRTPYEVANWIAETGRPLHWAELVRRLDRERRQACRRGALECLRGLATYARQVRSRTTFYDAEGRGFEAFADASDCLAFRAAARAR